MIGTSPKLVQISARYADGSISINFAQNGIHNTATSELIFELAPLGYLWAAESHQAISKQITNSTVTSLARIELFISARRIFIYLWLRHNFIKQRLKNYDRLASEPVRYIFLLLLRIILHCAHIAWFLFKLFPK